MFKSSRRDRIEAALDQIGGRLLEIIGRLTGRPSHKIKGKAARSRGAMRKGKAHTRRVLH